MLEKLKEKQKKLDEEKAIEEKKQEEVRIEEQELEESEEVKTKKPGFFERLKKAFSYTLTQDNFDSIFATLFSFNVILKPKHSSSVTLISSLSILAISKINLTSSFLLKF
jgi:hypothetical protein